MHRNQIPPRQRAAILTGLIFLSICSTSLSSFNKPNTFLPKKILSNLPLHRDGATFTHDESSSESTSPPESLPYDSYTKIALIQLNEKGFKPARHAYRVHTSHPLDDNYQEQELKFNPIASFVLEKWIKHQFMHSSDIEYEDEDGMEKGDIRGHLLAVPANADVNELDFLEGVYKCSGGDNTDEIQHYVGNMAETMGCIVDCIILFYDKNCVYRDKALVRLVKGIKRQLDSKKSLSAANEEDGDKIDVLVLVKDDDTEALKELQAIRSKLAPEDAHIGDMIKIIPIRELHYSSQSEREEWNIFKSLREHLINVADQSAVHENFVPMNEFPKFAKRVYSKFGGKVDDDSNDFVIKTRRLTSRASCHASNELQGTVQKRWNDVKMILEDKLNTLEGKQTEVLVDENKMPILEFGREASDILLYSTNAFETAEIESNTNTTFDREFVHEKRRDFILFANDGIRELFKNQIQHLRDYFGRRYEIIIEQLEEDEVDFEEMDDAEIEQKYIKHQKILEEEAKKATEGFRTAADNAIPSSLDMEALSELQVGYSYNTVLDGLIRDMMKATGDFTSRYEEWKNVSTEIPEDSEELESNERRPAKWYEKLAARALVFGVNYLQGWLAYQGIKNAAEQREKDMPKFPLF